MNLGGKLLIKIMKMKTNFIEIDYKEYNDAIEKSLFDESWIKNLYNDKENIISFFKILNEQRHLSFAADFIRYPNIKKIIMAKKDTEINNKLIEHMLNAGKAEENIIKINEIKSITNYYANITLSLFNEYSQLTRDFISGVIKPYPEQIEDTWKPIKCFRLITNEQEIVLKILNNKVLCNSENKSFVEYFNNRNKSKDLKRGYLTENQISQKAVKNVKRELLNLKEITIPTNYNKINNDNAKYKIIYKGNQTVQYNMEEVSIGGDNLKIYQILELK